MHSHETAYNFTQENLSDLMYSIVSYFSPNQMATHGSITPGGLRTIFLLLWSFVIIFTLCNLGQILTNKFDEFNDELVQCDWYLYPCKMQQIYAIMLVNAQQPTYLKAYANILCTRAIIMKRVHKFH